MLTAEARSRLTVVLVGARNPQNIGSAARALQDFGFSDLRIVNPFTPPFEAAQLEAHPLEAKSAVGAGEVMRSARLYAALPQAIADCSLIAGTTAIGGRELRLPVQTLREAAPLIRQALQTTVETSLQRNNPVGSADGQTFGLESNSRTCPAAGAAEVLGATVGTGPGKAAALTVSQSAFPSPSLPRVALLFGSEKTGLTNDQLSHCSLLLTIPLFQPQGRHLSMNLAQSVAVCLYELSREGFEGSRELPVRQAPPATSADRERLAHLLTDLMQQSGYARRFPANARPEIIRQLTGSLGQSREEASTWMGLLKQLQSGARSDPQD